MFSSSGGQRRWTEVVPQFERATGHKVLLDFANTPPPERESAAGETFDIAIVSPKAIEELLQQGTIAAGTQYNIGRTGRGHAQVALPTSARRRVQALVARRQVRFGYRHGRERDRFMSVLDRLGIARK